jgi:hypothetical protein
MPMVRVPGQLDQMRGVSFGVTVVLSQEEQRWL